MKRFLKAIVFLVLIAMAFTVTAFAEDCTHEFTGVCDTTCDKGCGHTRIPTRLVTDDDVGYQVDENGELILDDEGNPIKAYIQTENAYLKCAGNFKNIFDGDKVSSGLYSDNKDWCTVKEDTGTIIFKEELRVTGMTVYVTGNWTFMEFSAYDAEGNEVYKQNVRGDAENQAITLDFGASVDNPKNVKEIRLTPTGLKWDLGFGENNNPRTFKVAELEISIIAPHTYSNNCDAFCNECNEERTPSEHIYSVECDEICDECNENIRSFTDDEHAYAAGCDIICDLCSKERVVDSVANPHVFSGECDTECDGCGALRTVPDDAPHTPESECDELCNVCGSKITGVTTPHTYTNRCDNECNLCKNIRTAETDAEYLPDHEYSSDCDEYCNECDAQRTVEEAHKYSSACDRFCNDCRQERTEESDTTYVPGHNLVSDCDDECGDCHEVIVPDKPHTYDNRCDAECNECKTVRTKATDDTYIENHVYSSTCDDYCNECNAERKVSHSKYPHTYLNVCDATCEDCNGERTVEDDPTFLPNHLFDHDCDTTCNIEGCDYVRTVGEHQYDNACDAECNVKSADGKTKCGHKRQVPPHEYGEHECKSLCTICRRKRTTQTEHTFDGLCDEECNVCGEANQFASSHVYSGDCDTECNVCATVREVDVAHTFDEDCADLDCNVCGALRESEHTFGEWEQTVAPERKTEGENKRVCSVCGAEETEKVPALGGMSSGAIAGIAVGSVAVVGVGGFSAFWFGIKKKSLKDLVSVFKKKK